MGFGFSCYRKEALDNSQAMEKANNSPQSSGTNKSLNVRTHIILN